MKNSNNSNALKMSIQFLKTYEVLDPETGSVSSKIKYLIGNPKQYRFNGQTGRFNIDGEKDLGTSFELIPLAWRIFKASLFGRNKTEQWAEIFFIDDSNCVSSIMLNNTSAQILQNTFGKIIYEGLLLEDVKLKITAERRTNERVKGVYYIVQLSFQKAEDAVLLLNKEYAADYKIYRRDTITEGEEVSLASCTYRTPELEVWKEELLAETQDAA
jgi:hypothetical protein